MTMTLDGYTFPWEPDRWTIPIDDKYAASVLTYSSCAFLSFGTAIIGKRISLRWNWMSAIQFAQLQTILMKDVAVIWIPGDGYSYTVEILPPLMGEYFEDGGVQMPWRENVEMTLLITARSVES